MIDRLDDFINAPNKVDSENIWPRGTITFCNIVNTFLAVFLNDSKTFGSQKSWVSVNSGVE